MRGRRNIVKPCGRIAVVVRDSQGRFEEVFVARTAVHFPTTLADAAVGSRMNAPVQLFQIDIIDQLFAEITLVETSVLGYLQHKVGTVCGDTDLLHFVRIQTSGGKQ